MQILIPHTLKLFLKNDFEILKLISQDNDVTTFNNQLEYLLDMAELRVRDATLGAGVSVPVRTSGFKAESHTEWVSHILSTELLALVWSTQSRSSN